MRLNLSVLGTHHESLELASFTIPKAVEPQCSFIRGRNGWVVTASGGVDINGFEVVQNQVVDSTITETRTAALAATSSNRWWWNK